MVLHEAGLDCLSARGMARGPDRVRYLWPDLFCGEAVVLMGVRRTDPIEDRRRALVRQAAGQTSKFSIDGVEKRGAYAPRKPSLPKLPWGDEKVEDGHDD